jgi:membrane protein
MRLVRQSDAPGQKFLLALDVLRALHAAQGGAARGLSLAELASQLRADPLQVEPVLETLMNVDWVGRLDEPQGQRHVLLCQPANTQAQPLIDRFLLGPAEGAAEFRAQSGIDRLSLAQAMGT